MECLENQTYNLPDPESLLNIGIRLPDEKIYRQIKAGWDTVAKPIDGMGVFEKITAQIGAIKGSPDFSCGKKAVLVFCSDNGIVEEGVSQSTSEVTTKVVQNMLRGKSSVAVMAKKEGADLIVCDVGAECLPSEIEGCLDYKIRRGSRNFLKERAMTDEEVLRAVGCGIGLVKKLAEEGYGIIALGEMGIGNTTTSSAVCAAITGADVASVVGRGAGLSDTGLSRKREVIKTALERYGFGNGVFDGKEAFRALACVGGYDIAALCGAVIGGAKFRVPILLDGVITLTAALVAQRLVPGSEYCCILSHKGKEPAVEILERELCDGVVLHGVLDAQMALGEGTGAVMMFPLLDFAAEVYYNADRFEDLLMDRYKRF